MAFMKPDVQYFAAYHVDTECGGEIVPEDVCGTLDLTDAPSLIETCNDVLQYCEGSAVNDIARKQGFYARLSAAGYMDCTAWNGPYKTCEEALASLCAEYDCDENGDDCTDNG